MPKDEEEPVLQKLKEMDGALNRKVDKLHEKIDALSKKTKPGFWGRFFPNAGSVGTLLIGIAAIITVILVILGIKETPSPD